MTTTPRVQRQLPSLCGLNESCLEIPAGRAGADEASERPCSAESAMGLIGKSPHDGNVNIWQ